MSIVTQINYKLGASSYLVNTVFLLDTDCKIFHKLKKFGINMDFKTKTNGGLHVAKCLSWGVKIDWLNFGLLIWGRKSCREIYERTKWRYVRLNALNVLNVNGLCINAPLNFSSKIRVKLQIVSEENFEWQKICNKNI